MWAMDDGERVLTGKRAAAFAGAAGYLLSALETKDGEYPTGISPFDDLTYGQKVSCLDAVSADCSARTSRRLSPLSLWRPPSWWCTGSFGYWFR